MARAPKKPADAVELHVAGRVVTITNPTKVYFPDAGLTKLDLARYFLVVADGALRAAGGRPNVLVRYADGVAGQGFYQKRVPAQRPEWIETVTLSYPSGRSAEEVVPRDPSHLVWMANLGCLELHPHPVRAEDLEHPDELRLDLDPVPGVAWPQIREVARAARAVLDEVGLVGWPKTSGSRGVHVNVRLVAGRYTFADTWRAGLALARAIEARVPTLATTRWWKEERHGVFLDYNQNAKDRTTAAAYSVRPKPDARVSAPLAWGELDAAEPGDFTLRTMPARYAEVGDRHAAIDHHPCTIDTLLALADRQEADGATAPPRGARGQGAGRRVPTKPLVEIGRSVDKARALAGLERWRERHPEVTPHLQPADVLVDAMRGRSSVWTRIRVNLEHVPPELRPAPEPLDPDEPPSWGPPRGEASKNRRP